MEKCIPLYIVILLYKVESKGLHYTDVLLSFQSHRVSKTPSPAALIS